MELLKGESVTGLGDLEKGIFEMKNLVTEILFFVLFMAAFAIAMSWGLDRPVVHRSWTTKECVSVDDPSDRYSCEDQPSSALTVWVR